MGEEIQMASSHGGRRTVHQSGERGGARLKFLVVISLIAAAAYAGYQYVPVAYQAHLFKDLMQQSVDKAAVMGYTGDWVKNQLKASAKDYDVPPNANVTAAQRDGRIEARVQFTRVIPLLVYTHQYSFDYTVKSTELFMPK